MGLRTIHLRSCGRCAVEEVFAFAEFSAIDMGDAIHKSKRIGQTSGTRSECLVSGGAGLILNHCPVIMSALCANREAGGRGSKVSGR